MASEPPFAVGGDWDDDSPPRRRRSEDDEDSAVRRIIGGHKREALRRELKEYNTHRRSAFRKLYDRGELPVRVVEDESSSSRRRSIGWLIDDVLRLDLQFYVPLFIDAFSDPDEPFGFLASEAAIDVLKVAGPARRLFTVGPLVVKPLKIALRSTENAACRAMTFLRHYATACGSPRDQYVAFTVLDVKAVAAAVDSAVLKHPNLHPHASEALAAIFSACCYHMTKASKKNLSTALRTAVPGLVDRYLAARK